MKYTYDVAVIGGGPAGLQAALSLGRMHHETVLLDSGSYRNDPADAMHNLIGHDGQPPAQLRAAARAELAAYATVELRGATVDRVTPVQDGFELVTDGALLTAAKVILATGMRDELPATPGLGDLFGSVAAHCPYCHGHEYAGTHVGILGAGPHAGRVAMLLRRIASRITVFADGAEIDEPLLVHAGATVEPAKVTGVCRSATGVRVSLSDGREVDLGGLMVAPALSQAAPFAEQLGLELTDLGHIRVDPLGRTSLQGVYAAGDAVHMDGSPMPAASVAGAVFTGQAAAVAVDVDEIMALT